MTRCTRCLIPDTRPDTEFVDGVCTACINHDARKTIDWNARKAELLELRERMEPTKVATGYHCIVPSSGGKDSTYQVITLLELGFRPLVVTATTCMLTPIGRRNIDNLARYATTIEVTPNRTVRAKLNRIGIEQVGDISWPEHMAIFTIPFRVASQTGINALFFGENPQHQYGGPIGTENAKHLTRRWRSEFGGFLGLRPSDVVGMDGITADDMLDYQMPDDIEAKGIEAHFLGYYLPWDSRHNAEIAVEHGMETGLPSVASFWEFENLDNAMTGLHDYFGYLKYGYGRMTAQMSVDIRNGVFNRDAAEAYVRDRDGAFPHVYAGIPFASVLQHIGMSFEEFEKIADQFTNKALFPRVNEG